MSEKPMTKMQIAGFFTAAALVIAAGGITAGKGLENLVSKLNREHGFNFDDINNRACPVSKPVEYSDASP